MSTRVRIYPSQIQANFEFSVAKNAEKVGSAAKRYARTYAPSRTGYLRGTITYGRQPIGRYLYRIRLNAGAYYAGWVEKGTRTPIRPKRGKYLAVGKREGKNRGRGVPKPYVRGQRGQHYLERGFSAALIQYGYGPISEF